MENDKILFSQIKEGDKQSFELLFRSYYAPLCLFAKKYIKDEDDCEELVQSFFLKIWEKKASIVINTSVKSYLYGSIRNRSLNFIKHQKIKQDYQAEIVYSTTNEDYNSSNFMEVDLISKINKSIESLPGRRREIFVLSREHGLKYKEIAEKLGISIKTVETQMGHALKDLREKLKDYKQLLSSFFIFIKAKR